MFPSMSAFRDEFFKTAGLNPAQLAARQSRLQRAASEALKRARGNVAHAGPSVEEIGQGLGAAKRRLRQAERFDSALPVSRMTSTDRGLVESARKLDDPVASSRAARRAEWSWR